MVLAIDPRKINEEGNEAARNALDTFLRHNQSQTFPILEFKKDVLYGAGNQQFTLNHAIIQYPYEGGGVKYLVIANEDEQEKATKQQTPPISALNGERKSAKSGYIKRHLLGQGSFKKVYRVEHIISLSPEGLTLTTLPEEKRLSLAKQSLPDFLFEGDDIWGIGDFARFRRIQEEVEILKEIKHLEFKSAWESKDENERKHYILSAELPGQTLDAILEVINSPHKSREGTESIILLEPNESTTSALKKLITAQIIELALLLLEELPSQVHQYGFIHQDIKPHNIMVKFDAHGWPLKLIYFDFGLAAKLGQPVSGGRGTPAYMAPEALKASGGKIVTTEAADIYAVMIIIAQLFAAPLLPNSRIDDPDIIPFYQTALFKDSADRFKVLTPFQKTVIRCTLLKGVAADKPELRIVAFEEMKKILKKVAEEIAQNTTPVAPEGNQQLVRSEDEIEIVSSSANSSTSIASKALIHPDQPPVTIKGKRKKVQFEDEIETEIANLSSTNSPNTVTKTLTPLETLAKTPPRWAKAFEKAVGLAVEKYLEYLSSTSSHNPLFYAISYTKNIFNFASYYSDSTFDNFRNMLAHIVHQNSSEPGGAKLVDYINKELTELKKLGEIDIGSIQEAYHACAPRNYTISKDKIQTGMFKRVLPNLEQAVLENKDQVIETEFNGIKDEINELFGARGYKVTLGNNSPITTFNVRKFANEVYLETEFSNIHLQSSTLPDKKHTIPGTTKFIFKQINNQFELETILTSNHFLKEIFSAPTLEPQKLPAPTKTASATQPQIISVSIAVEKNLEHQVPTVAESSAQLQVSTSAIKETKKIPPTPEEILQYKIIHAQAEEKFYRAKDKLDIALNEITRHALSLTLRKKPVAFKAAMMFVTGIKAATTELASNFLDEKTVLKAYRSWQKECETVIQKANSVLAHHRDWKGRLANALFALTGIGGVLMIGKGAITFAMNGQADFLFFKTASKQKLDKVEEVMGVLKPSNWAAPAA